jgi:UDP-N-acetylmuramoyl-L-alanyl-D-glutamate--2,6-diaminopimelate ligase
MRGIVKKFIPSFLISWYHFLLAFLGVVIYGFPSKKLKVIGVTGTKGKSTVVELAGKILEEAGYKVASISSIRFKIADKEWQNNLKMTMPGRLKLQRFLRKAVNAGCQYAIIEVTSEGILQHRHRFIDFEVAVFTNLSPEHIERHALLKNIAKLKGNCFNLAKKSIF